MPHCHELTDMDPARRRSVGGVSPLVSVLRGLVIGALSVVLTQVAPAPAAAERPTSGPAVLFSPFYYRNEGDTPDHRLEGGRRLETWEGLFGPLMWTNPQRGPSGVAFQSPTLGVEAVGTEPPRSVTADGTIRRVQSEELVQLPPPEKPSASRIPYEPVPTPKTNTPTGPVALAEAESLGEEPTEPRLQFLRGSTVLLEPGELQIDVGLTYVLTEDDFPVVQNTMSGSQVLDGSLKQRQLFIPLEMRLGVTPRVQLFGSLPIGWSHSEFAAAGAIDIDDSEGGLGDIGLGATMLLFDGQGQDTDVVFTFAATLPTSDSPFISGSTGFGQPTLGDGFYALSGDMLWINNYDPIVIFYGLGYRHQFERQVAGVQVDPGEEARVQLGVGFAVNQSVTLSARFAASFVSRVQFDGQSFAGSYSEPMTLRFATTVLRECRIVEPFVQFGTTDDAASTAFGVVSTY